MSGQHDHEPVRVGRTRTSATLMAVIAAVILLVLLIIFIAQNNRQVPVSFLGATGHFSEALALLVAAVAGAIIVLVVGLARIVQLRVAGHRHNRAMARQATTAAPAGSAPATAQSEPQPVEPQG